MSAIKYEFGHFVFDAQRRVLLRDGAKIALPNKTLEVLALLLREAGKPVSKEQMHATVWGDSFVDDANLTQNIYVLRKALANGMSGKIVIRTIPKLGYQFVEPLKQSEVPLARRGSRLPFALVAAAVLAAVIVLAFALVRAPQGSNAEALLPTPALKAYELGRTAWIKPTRASGLRARAEFQRVVRLAPRNPLGYAGLSDAYLLIAGQSAPGKVRRAFCDTAARYAQYAVSLDPNSSEAHASNAQALYYRKQPGAQDEFERAIALNPKNALAHRWYGEYWLMHGNFDAAVEELARSNALQPPVAQDLFWLGVAQYYARHFSDAARTFRETIAAGGSDPEIGLHLALAYDASGNPRAALHELDRLRTAPQETSNVHVIRASVLAPSQRTAALREISAALHSNGTPASAVSVAIAFARAGEVARARAWLRAHQVRSDETSIFPRFDPRLAGLQLFPRRYTAG